MYKNKVDQNLINYIEKNVFPIYDLNGESHNLNHIKYVLNRAFEISKPYETELDYNILYTAVAYHDIGDHIDRKNHEKVSAKWMYEDKELEKYFNIDEREIIKEAIEDHRSSSKSIPRSLYGKILASADKNVEVDVYFKRAYGYGLEHYPELDQLEQIERVYAHAIEKFGKNGYAVSKYYVEDTKYAEYLEKLQELIENKEEFIRRCKEVNGIL